jgi:hypothetical protein
MLCQMRVHHVQLSSIAGTKANRLLRLAAVALNHVGEVYRVQVREISAIGVFLAQKKYRFLKLACLTFLFGLLASAAMFALVETLL